MADNDTKATILLRRRSSDGKAKVLIEARPKKEDRIQESIEDLFLDFVERVRVKLPLDLKKEEVDIYVGIWRSRATFKIPKEFFDLISEQGWQVEFDIND